MKRLCPTPPTTASPSCTTSTWRATCASTTSPSTPIFVSAKAGRALELGCGNGRVLLELVGRDIDAVGVDISRKMLQQLQRKAGERGVDARVCQMDARRLAFGRSFDIVLCPYSLVTYMAQPDDLQRMLSEVRQVLRAGGVLVLDAFIPRDASGRRRLPARLSPPAGRRGAGALQAGRARSHLESIESSAATKSSRPTARCWKRVETSEEIRTFSPDELTDALSGSGFSPQQVWWDYGQGVARRGSAILYRRRATDIRFLSGRCSCARHSQARAPQVIQLALHVQIGELLVQLAELGQVVDDDVHVLRMLRQIILVIILGRIERLQRSDLGHDRPRE